MGIMKIGKEIGLACGIFLFYISTSRVHASEIDNKISKLQIEGVSSNVPEFNIFCRNSEELDEHLSVSYGDEHLENIKITSYEKSNISTEYYILLDVTASNDKEYFDKMKKEIASFVDNLGENEKSTIISFGNTTNILIEHTKDTDKVWQTIKDIENIDTKTTLFEAIEKTALLADEVNDYLGRKVIILFSDGGNFAKNTTTQNEALHTLNKTGVPLYAVIADHISHASNPYIETVGEFSRQTGGVCFTISSDEESSIEQLNEALRDISVVSATAKSNIVDYSEKNIVINNKSGAKDYVSYTANHYKKDTTSPLANFKEKKDKQIILEFSEAVSRADEKGNYKIVCSDNENDNDNVVPVYDVHYKDEKLDSVILSFEQELINGDYSIELSNISDISMEKNKVEGKISFEITDGKDKENEKNSFFTEYLLLFILIGVSLGLIIILLIVWSILKKRKTIIQVDGRTFLEENVDVEHNVVVEKKTNIKHQVVIEQEKEKSIYMYIEGTKDGNRKIETFINKSIIIGRSNICDVFINDPRLSRQHFIIYDEEDGFYVEDLNTTNGTYLNDRQIFEKIKLEKMDKIAAGDIIMRVDW